jgi:hypothetical protein
VDRGCFVGVPVSYRRGKTSAFTIEITCPEEMTIYWSSFHGHTENVFSRKAGLDQTSQPLDIASLFEFSFRGLDLGGSVESV